ncbi:MAG: HAD family hydrolase [Desulfosporosinus sp.]|nr:HAD family hydrolase [Desulfosporosinus sp.]
MAFYSKGRMPWKRAANLDAVVFDKTGTLTKGEPSVTDVYATEGFVREDVLRLAAITEKPSEHPLGEAIVRGAKEEGLSVGDTDDFEAIPGHGVRAIYLGQTILLGNRRLMQQQNY